MVEANLSAYLHGRSEGGVSKCTASVYLLIGLWVDGALVGVDEDVLARGLEGRVEVGLAVELGVRHAGCMYWGICEVRCFGFGLENWPRTGSEELERSRNGAGSKYPLLFAHPPLLGPAVPLVETHYGEGGCLAVKHQNRHELQEFGSGER